MQYLNERYRLLKPDAFDGFVPGEGAGFLLLVSPGAEEHVKQGLTSCIGRPGLSFEDGHLMGGAAYSGEALSSAFLTSLNGISSKVGKVYSCENGEMHYSKELSVALIRQRESMAKACEIIRPAKYFGDFGAAFGVASLNVGVDENILAYCSSDSGQHSSVIIFEERNL